MTAPSISVMTNGQRLNSRLLGSLSNLEVRESDMDSTVVVLRFQLVQRPSGNYSPIDDDEFQAGVPIAVEIAAAGGLPQRLIDGYVTHVRPHFEEIEANCYVEVIAMDKVALLNAEERSASYPDVSDKEAVEQVLGRYQIPFVGDDTPARQMEDGQLLMQRASDWQFIKQLAQRNGYVAYFEYDENQDDVVGYFRQPAISDTPQADLTILRENQNLKWIDFQLDMTTPVRMVGSAVDPIQKRLIRTTGVATLDEMGASGYANQLEQGYQGLGVDAFQRRLRDPFPSDEAINAVGSGATDNNRFSIQARGELDPALYRGLLRARRPVLIKGVGESLTGAYYVKSVRSVLDKGSLTQSFIAVRNALGQSGGESFGQDAEEVPPE